MLPDVSHILLEREGDTLTIWFNRPEVRNALSTEVADDLAAVLEALPAQADIRFVVLRGKGGVFCAGGDLKMFKSVFQGGAERADIVRFNADFGRLMRAVQALPQLFIVLIEGAAMAGGLGLSCLADVVVTTRDARYALSEVTLGIPPAQITPVVMQRIGASQARRLLLTAAVFDGAEAGALGFAHFVVDDAAALEARAQELLAQARRGSPGAIAATKAIINESSRLQGDELVQFAAERFADCMLGDEAREGLAAFAEKRSPSWSK
ncbi:MAG: enoyl-CoA hydratase/isomerase family protein [Pseudomonadales bacterium]|nr:enoyl-CoA hydratase/isomerase family protein [Pseudomonadales bacterium]MCP5190448.1 enoyl-CoA hydratase/isomerase family protein [Pseudomonadales bacterium]